MAWPGRAWKSWLCKAGLGILGAAGVWCGVARQGLEIVAGHGTAWHGLARHGWAWKFLAGPGKARPGPARQGKDKSKQDGPECLTTLIRNTGKRGLKL